MATITETGTIDLKAQKEAHDEAISAASSDATSKANAAAKTATNYITADSTGITVRMSQNATTYQRLTASESTWYVSGKKRSSVDGNGLKVYVGNAGSEVEVATFGDTVRLGKSGEGNVYIDSRGLSVYTDSIHEIVSAKNNNDSSTGLATIHEILATSFRSVVNSSGTHSETILRTEYPVVSIISCYEHGTESSLNFAIDGSDNTILYLSGTYYKTVDVTYETDASIASMKLGAYAQSDGPDSLALGESHTYGSDSLAFGSDCESNGHRSIAGGTFSKANGRSSIAIGEGNEANFTGSAAFGNETVANGPYQFVIGRANIINNPYRANNLITDKEYAFIIGNGDSSTRSNAFTVDWSGNTFPSGNIELKVPTIDRDNPSSSIYDSAHGILLLDKDGELIGIIRCLQLSDGRIGTTIAAYNENTSGSQVNNALNVMVDRNGASSYSMTDPAAFRSAIAAFSTSGGTITGLVAAKNTVIDRKVNPSSAQYTTDVGGGSSFQLVDKNGAVLGYIRASKQTDGRTGLDLRAWNSKTDGSSVVSGGIQILIDRSGAVTYSIYNQANFRNAIGASSGIFPRSVGGTGMSARTTGTVTRSGVNTDGTLNVYSNGVTCTLAASNVKLKAALANSSTVQLATLPTGYRPPMNVFTNISSPAQSPNGGAWVRVDSSGVVTLGNYSGAQFTTSTQLYFTITWAL